ncbi:hypothetical protein GGX14DRAFT_374323, partial [Mycena pura]
PIPIDPALQPLPASNDRDLTDPSTIAHARGLKKAERVAGYRQKSRPTYKGKGKGRAVSSSDSEASDSSESEVEVVGKGRGRPAGSGNYSKPDVNKLLDLTEKLRPAGAKGWGKLAKKFNRYAVKNKRPQREVKALENKYKSLLRTKKPTGDAECPPEIKRAHHIEELINEKVGTRGLSDDEQSGSNASDVQVIEPVRTAIARRAATPPLRSRRATGADLLATFNRAFDPTMQQAREDTRSQRSFKTAQLLAVTQQLDVLRTENNSLRDEVNDLKRELDRMEFQLQFARVTNGGGGFDNDRGRLKRRRRSHRDLSRDCSGLQRVRGKIRCEETFPEGGGTTYWVTDASSDASDFDYRCKKKTRVDTPLPFNNSATHTPVAAHYTSMPGPSRRSPEPTGSTSLTGEGVELTFTPHRSSGDAVKFVLTPKV